MIAFVASNRAAFITGVAIPVDGGFSVHGPSYADEIAMWASASRSESAARSEKFGRVLTARGRTTIDAEDTALFADLFSDDVVWHGADTPEESATGREHVVERWNAIAGQGLSAQMGENDVVYADDTHVVGVLELRERQQDDSGRLTSCI